MEDNRIGELMDVTMTRIKQLVDTNTIVGSPIVTPDGIMVIPVSRVSFGFGTGGSDYGKTVDKFGGAGAAGVRIDPVSFLIIKDGVTRVVPVALPAIGPVDRILDMVPEVMDRVESFVAKKKEEKNIF